MGVEDLDSDGLLTQRFWGSNGSFEDRPILCMYKEQLIGLYARHFGPLYRNGSVNIFETRVEYSPLEFLDLTCKPVAVGHYQHIGFRPRD